TMSTANSDSETSNANAPHNRTLASSLASSQTSNIGLTPAEAHSEARNSNSRAHVPTRVSARGNKGAHPSRLGHSPEISRVSASQTSVSIPRNLPQVFEVFEVDSSQESPTPVEVSDLQASFAEQAQASISELALTTDQVVGVHTTDINRSRLSNFTRLPPATDASATAMEASSGSDSEVSDLVENFDEAPAAKRHLHRDSTLRPTAKPGMSTVAPVRTRWAHRGTTARTIIQLPSIWAMFTSTEAMHKVIRRLLRRAAVTEWDSYVLFCYSCAFSNVHQAVNAQPEVWAETMTQIVNIADADRTPDNEDCPEHRRFPVPQEGDVSPHISEISASAMTFTTLASCCPLSIESWLTDNCLPEDFLDISKFPDALVRPERPIDDGDWYDANCTYSLSPQVPDRYLSHTPSSYVYFLGHGPG
ncbi:hypothetical protein B484DRAFT_463055, partial [Ochromonadaceae sp. CCMP2298]